MANKKFDKMKYDVKYVQQNYDQILFKVPKGCKEILKDIALDKGTSVTQIVVEALENYYDIDLHEKIK